MNEAFYFPKRNVPLRGIPLFLNIIDRLTPVFDIKTAFENHSNAVRFTLCRFASVSLLYANDDVALYAATLDAFTIFPRKARRDPMYVLVSDESLLALAYDTPPFEYALLLDR